MLSSDTTHAVISRLLHADAHADAHGWGSPPVLLLLQDQPLTAAGRRRLRVVVFSLQAQEVAEHPQGIVGLLPDIADYLADADADARAPGWPADLELGIHADFVTVPAGSRLLAWAVLYEDVHADTADVHDVRRVDAVDVDGRVYQISRRRGEAVATVRIDARPDPHDTPATHPGLSALVAVTQQLSTTREEAQQ